MVLMDEPAAIEEAVRIIGKGSVRLAVDSVGGDATATLVQLLSDRGVLVSYSAASGRPMAVNALFLIGKHLTVKGFFLGDFDHVSKVLAAQIEAAPLVASGALCVPVAAVYPMPKIKEAVTHLLKGGKILIDIAGLSMRDITTVQFEESELSWSGISNRRSRRNRGSNEAHSF